MRNEEYLDNILKRMPFELKLSKDVYWIPYTFLCEQPIYSYKEIEEISKLMPEEKRQFINTIEDAIKLFVISDFSEMDDTVKICKKDICWEYYADGEQAMLANQGCCSTCCAWANYLLKDNFDEVGIIGIIRPVGGHAINYFYTDGWFYIMDFQTLIGKYRDKICPQTGKRKDFVKSGFISGILVRAKSLEAYVQYYSRYTQQLIPEHLFLRETMPNACPIGEKKAKDGIRKIYIPKEMKVDLIEQKKQPLIIKCEKV